MDSVKLKLFIYLYSLKIEFFKFLIKKKYLLLYVLYYVKTSLRKTNPISENRDLIHADYCIFFFFFFFTKLQRCKI